MSWVRSTGFVRRPLVVVEDHLHHVTELLAAMAAADAALPGATTVLCLDRPGPDTESAACRWLAAYPGLQVAASIGATGATGATEDGGEGRRAALPPEAFADSHRFARTLAGFLRPGGLLLQDVQLSTLAFLRADRWWESIYLASTVRGMFAANPPACRFLSNKRGYEATFGRDLVESGFDPRDVMDKSELAAVVVPTVRAYLSRAFPLVLKSVQEGTRRPDVPLARGDDDRGEAERELDLLVWEGDGACELGGRLLAGRVGLKAGSQEAESWRELLRDRLEEGPGVPVVALGRRVAPEGADRAELTNLAARHVHGLRGRLEDGAAIETVQHAYRLRRGLAVGWVVARV